MTIIRHRLCLSTPFESFSENAGKIYVFFTPQFPPVGWENSQPGGTPTVCQKKKQKKRKGKQNMKNKQS